MAALFKVLLLIGSFLSVLMVKIYNPNYQDDNPVEEAVEQVIKYETGEDVDLTPFSPEEK